MSSTEMQRSEISTQTDQQQYQQYQQYQQQQPTQLQQPQQDVNQFDVEYIAKIQEAKRQGLI